MEDNNSKDKICTSVEIPDGYAINLKESDFSKGDIVLSRIDSIENIYNATVKDIISDWENFTGDNYESISKHFDTMPSDCVLLYHVNILRSFFVRRVNSDNWTRGQFKKMICDKLGVPYYVQLDLEWILTTYFHSTSNK